ncbi:MAG: tetratricopeptide repeat protein [Minicystis sp.]
MAIDRDKVLEAAQAFVEKKRYDKAIVEYQKVLAADPKDARTLLKIGEVQVKAEQFEPAIATFEQVGQLLATQGFALKAVAAYQQARDVVQRHVPHLTDRFGYLVTKMADLYVQLRRPNDAIQLYEETAARLEAAGRQRDAIDLYKKIVDLDPQSFERAHRLAEAQMRVGDVEGAGPHLAILAEGLAARGQHDDAINMGERAIAVKPDLKLARLLAQLYLDRGGPKDGAAAFVKIQILYKQSPKDLDTLGLLARALYVLRQPEKAIEVHKEAARVALGEGKQDAFDFHMETLVSRAPNDAGVRKLASSWSKAPPWMREAPQAPQPPPPPGRAHTPPPFTPPDGFAQQPFAPPPQGPIAPPMPPGRAHTPPPFAPPPDAFPPPQGAIAPPMPPPPPGRAHTPPPFTPSRDAFPPPQGAIAPPMPPGAIAPPMPPPPGRPPPPPLPQRGTPPTPPQRLTPAPPLQRGTPPTPPRLTPPTPAPRGAPPPPPPRAAPPPPPQQTAPPLFELDTDDPLGLGVDLDEAAPPLEPAAPPPAAPIAPPLAAPIASATQAPPPARPLIPSPARPLIPSPARPMAAPSAPIAPPLAAPIAPPLAAPIAPPIAPPLAAPIAVPPAYAEPVAGPPSSPMEPPPSSFAGRGGFDEDALEEVDFFVSQGMYEDAISLLDEQLARLPNHPLLLDRKQEIQAMADEAAASGNADPWGSIG